MRTATIALLLCCLLAVHEAQAWVKVWKYGPMPVITARRLVWARLGWSPFTYGLQMDWARGMFWNFFRGRYMQYRVYFRVYRFGWRYSCKATVRYPKFAFPWFMGGVPSFFNTCTPF